MREINCFVVATDILENNFFERNWPKVLAVTPIGMDNIGLIRTAMMIDKVIDVSLLMAIRNKQKM